MEKDNYLVINRNGNVHSSEYIREDRFIAGQLISADEKRRAFHLRHTIFAQELGWVQETENELEIDDYDNYAIFFGVSDIRGRLLAHMRLLPADTTFMLEREFITLVGPEHKIRKERDTAELSRCCLVHEARKYKIYTEFGLFDIFTFLFKAIYRWCMKKGIRYIYGVTDQRIYKLLLIRGFPFKAIGSPSIMPDGLIATAVLMDWREFEILNRVKRPSMLKWFTQYQSTSVPARRQLPEIY